MGWKRRVAGSAIALSLVAMPLAADVAQADALGFAMLLADTVATPEVFAVATVAVGVLVAAGGTAYILSDPQKQQAIADAVKWAGTQSSTMLAELPGTLSSGASTAVHFGSDWATAINNWVMSEAKALGISGITGSSSSSFAVGSYNIVTTNWHGNSYESQPFTQQDAINLATMAQDHGFTLQNYMAFVWIPSDGNTHVSTLDDSAGVDFTHWRIVEGTQGGMVNDSGSGYYVAPTPAVHVKGDGGNGVWNSNVPYNWGWTSVPSAWLQITAAPQQTSALANQPSWFPSGGGTAYVPPYQDNSGQVGIGYPVLDGSAPSTSTDSNGVTTTSSSPTDGVGYTSDGSTAYDLGTGATVPLSNTNTGSVAVGSDLGVTAASITSSVISAIVTPIATTFEDFLSPWQTWYGAWGTGLSACSSSSGPPNWTISMFGVSVNIDPFTQTYWQSRLPTFTQYISWSMWAVTSIAVIYKMFGYVGLATNIIGSYVGSEPTQLSSDGRVVQTRGSEAHRDRYKG